MNRTHVVAIISTTLLALPLLALAQENQPQPGFYCPHITRDLKLGDNDATTGGQVSELQRFFASYYEDYPDWAITGNFRGTTLSYVQRFQREQNLPAFGYVGPLTRAAIQRVCAGTTYTPPPLNNQSCITPWGTIIANNASTIAYQSSSVPQGSQCQFETRICLNGTLSGSYEYQACVPATIPTPPPADPLLPSCTLSASPTSIIAGQSAYLALNATNAISGTIDNGVGAIAINGTQAKIVTPSQTTTYTATVYGHQTVAICSATVTVTAPATNASCSLDGVTVTHNQTRKFYDRQSGTAAECGVAGWDRTCTNGTLSGTDTYRYAACSVTAPQATNVGSCTYKGQSYAEGQSINVVDYGTTYAYTCDNGSWVYSNGQNACDQTWISTAGHADLGCTNPYSAARAYLAVTPRHGKSPLSVSATTFNHNQQSACPAYTLSWGDGAIENYPARACNPGADVYSYDTRTHTYSAAGSHVISYTSPEGYSNSANIRVDAAGTASANNSSQLASALAALETALKAILQLLK